MAMVMMMPMPSKVRKEKKSEENTEERAENSGGPGKMIQELGEDENEGEADLRVDRRFACDESAEANEYSVS